MTQETEMQLQQEVLRLREEQRVLELKERLKKEEEYRYLKILLGQEVNQSMEKIVIQLNSISQQVYDLNKVLAGNKGMEVEGEVPEIDPPTEEEPEQKVEEEVTEEEEPIEEETPEEEVKEIKKETKKQKEIRKEIEKLQKKIVKLNK